MNKNLLKFAVIALLLGGCEQPEVLSDEIICYKIAEVNNLPNANVSLIDPNNNLIENVPLSYVCHHPENIAVDKLVPLDTKKLKQGQEVFMRIDTSPVCKS